MENIESTMTPQPGPYEKLSLSLAEEVHLMRNILSSLSEEISLLKGNQNVDETPFLSQRGECFTKLEEIRKKRADELRTLHIEKNWDAIVVGSCELQLLESQIVSLFQKIQDETKILTHMRTFPKRTWTLQTTDYPKSKIHLTTEPWNKTP